MNTKTAVGCIPTALLAWFVPSCTFAYAGVPHSQKDKKAPASAQTSKTAPTPVGCATLTSAALEKVLGQPFQEEPSETKSPPAYDGAWGWSCQYSSRKPASQGGVRVDLLIYEEASAAEAKQTFDKAAVFFIDSSKPKPSIGDSAYWQSTDKGLAIHVLRGNVHFSFQIEPSNEKQLNDLATALAARL